MAKNNRLSCGRTLCPDQSIYSRIEILKIKLNTQIKLFKIIKLSVLVTTSFVWNISDTINHFCIIKFNAVISKPNNHTYEN